MTTSPDAPQPAAAPAPLPPRRRRRVWRWIVIPCATLLLTGTALRLFVFTQSNELHAVLNKIRHAQQGSLEEIETPWTGTISSMAERLDETTGVISWLYFHLPENSIESLLDPFYQWHVNVPPLDATDGLSDEEFKTLTTSRQVTEFYIGSDAISPARAEMIARMPWVNRLSLSLSGIDRPENPDEESPAEPIYAQLKKTRNLTNLQLAINKTTPSLLQWLTDLPRLEELDISCNAITPEFLTTLGKIKTLKSLHLSGNFFSLPGNQQLLIEIDQDTGAPKKIQVARHREEPAIPQFDLTFPRLQHLEIETSISDSPWETEVPHQLFQQNPQIESLQLGMIKMTNQLATDIANLKHVTHLEFSSLGPLRPKVLRVATTLPNLKTLTFTFCQLDDESIDLINQCKSLQTIDFGSAEIDATTAKRVNIPRARVIKSRMTMKTNLNFPAIQDSDDEE